MNNFSSAYPPVQPVLTENEAGLYIHIPFCDHKCIYCDFYSIITEDNLPRFFRLLISEIEHYAALYAGRHTFSTIYFGGGTPSFVPPGFIKAVIDKLRSLFRFTPEVEVTLETNPGTVDKGKIQAFIDAGINRFSVGVQSFDEDDLKFLTRIHSPETARTTITTIAECGIDNISLDLIFNLPGQSAEKWAYNLSQACALPVKHISAYSLILERGTILNKMVLDGKVTMQDEYFDAELYRYTIDTLEATGFGMYEVSNFARPGYASRHNSLYWRYHNYLSFGPSAHSFMEGKRWWNISGLTLYLNALEKTGTGAAGSELIPEDAAYDEYIMLALRSYGIEINDAIARFPVPTQKLLASDILKKAEENRLLLRNEAYIRCTAEGYAVADEIIKEFLSL